MSKNAIEVEGLTKVYRLGYTGTGTLKDDLAGWWAKMRGKPNPNLVVDVNIRTDEKSVGYVYALNDINLNVEQGEVLGIIGKNGAGKSTLLKILTRVTGPTTGIIRMKGRVGSLLEVGTGFNTELSGRENVYLNGAILGMRKHEIDRKFFDIVEFAGVAKYIDTPVKRYSSGMRVRLGFAVAAFLEPEIMIIDEVLAVGDAEFQKNAIEKMQEVSREDGRTVLFVSHNMGSILSLCPNSILLDNGSIAALGASREIVNKYLKIDNSTINSGIANFKGTSEYELFGPEKIGEIISLETLNENKQRTSNFLFGDKLVVRIKFKIHERNENLEIGIGVVNSNNEALGCFVSNWNGFTQYFDKGNYTVDMLLPFIYLMPGSYLISCWLKQEGRLVDSQYARVLRFSVLENTLNGNRTYLSRYKQSNITLPADWSLVNE